MSSVPLTYGMTINGKHTYRDYGLILTSAPYVERPEMQTEYVEVTGLNGALDYSTVLTDGEPRYKNREGSWTFHVTGRDNYAERVAELMNALHGVEAKIVFDDTPDYYYEGRLTVNEFVSDARGRVITLDYVLDPFKRTDKNTANYDWLWDDLFDLTIIYGKFHVDGTKWRNLINQSQATITPTYTCSASMQVAKDGTTYQLVEGENAPSNLALAPGDNIMEFIGTGDVTVSYPLGASL